MITSRANPQVKEIRRLKVAKFRQARREFFVEGIRLVEEALQTGEMVRIIAYSPRLEKTPRGAQLLSSARSEGRAIQWLYVSDEVLAALSDTRSHQGVLAVVAMREYGWSDLEGRRGLFLLFHELQDPGNLGTIFRLAEAGGAAGLVLSPGTLDPYNPKVVRASMGSLLRVPFLVHQDLASAMDHLRSRGHSIWAADARAKRSFWEVDFTGPAAVLLGQEGSGLPSSLIQAADGTFAIPMEPPVESLNVAMAAGLILYEAFRQRQAAARDETFLIDRRRE